MSDLLTDQLLEASYRGVPFRVRSEVQNSIGRKIVLHEYVNSPKRFVEDLGLISPKFTIEAFVHGTDFGDKARALESVLNQGGEGVLVLPTLGSFKVHAMPYTKRASQRNVGEIVYTLEFAAGRPGSGPTKSTSDTQEVFDFSDTSRQTMTDNIEFFEPVTAVNIEQFASDLTVASQTLLDEFNDILPLEELTALTDLVDNVAQNAVALTQTATGIAENFIVNNEVVGIWQTLSFGLTGSTFAQIGTAFTRIIKLTSFGENGAYRADSTSRAVSTNGGIPLWPATTAQRINRNENRLRISAVNRVNAMLVGYEIAARRDYTTQEEIADAKELIEAAHESVMWDETTDENLIQSNPLVRAAIEDARQASLSVIEQKRQQLTSTVIITQHSTSSSFVEAYSLYSDSFLTSDELETRAMELRALNPERPAAGLVGETTIFRT